MDKGKLRMNFIKNRNKNINLTYFNYDYSLIEDYLTKIVSEYTEKKNFNLIISYYKSKNIDRNKEIDLTIKLNLQNKLFNKIIVIDDTNQFINNSGNDNVIIIKDNRRLLFNDFFIYANEFSDDDTITILCNSDIIIGENFDKITLNDKEMLFLSRYEMLLDTKNELNSDFGSFDTWVWKGKILENIGKFRMGIGACDVRLAREFYDCNYILKNPSIDLKTYHLHCTNIRYWLTEGNAPGPCLKIKHSKLEDKFSKDDYIFLN
jgi:hypothetical protein